MGDVHAERTSPGGPARRDLDQAVKTSTKPAVVGIIPSVNRMNTVGLLSS